jgi:hypothetical protein
MTFTYWTPTQKQPAHKAVRRKIVPQAAPASQTGETHSSIEVHATGR